MSNERDTEVQGEGVELEIGTEVETSEQTPEVQAEETPAEQEEQSSEEVLPSEGVQGEQQVEAEGEAAESEEVKAEAAEPAAPKEPPVVDEGEKRAAKWAMETDEMLRRKPKLRLSYLESLEEEGRLDPSWKGELDALRSAVLASPKKQAETVAAPAPELVEAEVRKKAKLMYAEGREDEAAELIADWKIQNGIGKRMSEMEQRQKAEDQRREQESRDAMIRQREDANRQEVVSLATAYPELVEKTERGVRFKDKAFHDALIKNVGLVNPATPLKEVAEFTLFKMGRLSAPKQKEQQQVKPVTKPSVKPAVGTIRRDKIQPGEVGLSVRVG